MASLQPLKKVFDTFNDHQLIDSHTVRFTGALLGGPFYFERVFGGHTFALAYMGLKILTGDVCLSKIQLNLFRPAVSDSPIDVKLKPSASRTFFQVDIIQKDVLIATANMRTVPSNAHRLQSPCRPSLDPLPSSVTSYPLLEDMKLLGTQPDVSAVSDGRYNKEWMFQLRPVDWNHFFGIDRQRKPDSAFAQLNKSDIQLDLDGFDPVCVLFLLADFIIFQDVINVHKFFGHFDEMFGGSTMNFSANIFDMSGIQPYTQLYIENLMDVFANEKSLIPGKIFDMNGRCIMSFRQENFRMSNK